MNTETTSCASCANEIHKLDVFPGGICVACYSMTPEANAPLTAESVSQMWKKVVK